MTGDSMIKLVLTDMDDTLIPAGHDGASDYAIEGIHAMQAAGLHFGPVSGRQPSAMGWMFRNRSEKNKHPVGDVCEITAWGAKVRTLVIATDEELMIARDTKEVLEK